MNWKALLGSMIFASAIASQPALGADEYVFDTSHTEISFEWDHFGFSTTRGHFDEFDGSLLLDESDIPASRVEVAIDTTSLDTNHADRDEHLRSDDFFHTSEHPQATFTSTAITETGENRYEVTGDLTLHGKTQPVTLDATINKIAEHPVTEARTLGFDATTTLERSAFGMGKYTPAVSDEVVVHISAEMPRKADLEE